MWVRVDEVITLHCDVPFATPPNLPITWMFAKDLRTQDLALFEELQGSAEGPLSLTIQDPTPGTIACRLGVLSEPLVRKYFYLNGALVTQDMEKANDFFTSVFTGKISLQESQAQEIRGKV
ncbi:sperm acrosome membrane-associated protein 6 [Grus japonensis]|uniref:Sperm acrosome membrane-associated protein 6 n=1 Tax=Grus japonensis TaxID=30415 RepID=A0ABC9XJR2_GRUJA